MTGDGGRSEAFPSALFEHKGSFPNASEHLAGASGAHLGQIWAHKFAATQSDVRLRGQYLLPTQVGMAVACCDLQSPQLVPKLKCPPNKFCLQTI